MNGNFVNYIVRPFQWCITHGDMINRSVTIYIQIIYGGYWELGNIIDCRDCYLIKHGSGRSLGAAVLMIYDITADLLRN